MARSVKPRAYPEWLFDQAKAFPLKQGTMCLWLCSGCGAPYWYPQIDGKHGRPVEALAWKPSLAPYVGPCWRSKDYGVKCVTPKGRRWLFHEGMPAIEQPEQPDLENIQEIIATRGGRRPAKGQQRTKGGPT